MPLHVRDVPVQEDEAAVQGASTKVLARAADVAMVNSRSCTPAPRINSVQPLTRSFHPRTRANVADVAEKSSTRSRTKVAYDLTSE